ncbi:MAG: hypothetical protein JSU81_02705 [Candidatus Coatesbacteria bacterium]|nr:MAG: hypothetical protein JSU81_02705 [Candidatus Coatesbacteria bacterium]
MKKAVGAILLVSAALASEVVIKENFNKTEFPPEGWILYGWSWKRKVEIRGGKENGYAHFYSERTIQYHELKSPPVYIEPGQVYFIKFLYRYTETGTVSTKKVYFFDRNYGYWGPSITSPWVWRKAEFRNAYPSERAYPQLVFIIGSIYDASSATWDVDDVEVVKCDVGVTPQSFGKLKALYK